MSSKVETEMHPFSVGPRPETDIPVKPKKENQKSKPEPENNGQGVDDEDRSVVFEPDTKANDTRSSAYKGVGDFGVRGVGRQGIEHTPFQILGNSVDFAGMSVQAWDTLYALFDRQFEATMTPDQIAELRATIPEHKLPEFDREVAQIEFDKYDDRQAKIRVATQAAFAAMIQAASGTTTGLAPVAGVATMATGMEEIQRRLDEDKQLQHGVDIKNAELAQKFNESYVDWAKDYNKTLTEREKIFNKFLIEKMKADIDQYKSILASATSMYKESTKATVDADKRMQTAITEHDKTEAIRKWKQAELNFKADEANARFVNAAEISRAQMAIRVRELERADLVTAKDMWHESSAYITAMGADPHIFLPSPMKHSAEVLNNVMPGVTSQVRQIKSFYEEEMGGGPWFFGKDEHKANVMRQTEMLTFLASNGYNFNVQNLKMKDPKTGKSPLETMLDPEFTVPIVGGIGAALSPEATDAILSAANDKVLAKRGFTLDSTHVKVGLLEAMQGYEAVKDTLSDADRVNIEARFESLISGISREEREHDKAYNDLVRAQMSEFFSNKGKAIKEKESVK